jgi:four helix bundle protein
MPGGACEFWRSCARCWADGFYGGRLVWLSGPRVGVFRKLVEGRCDKGPMSQIPETQKQVTGNRSQVTTNGPERERDPITATSLRKGSSIAQRMLTFSAAILRIAKGLPRDAPTRHITMQIVRAATGAGANYEEARAAESSADLIHKLGVANKELREALYWLALIDEARLVSVSLEMIAREGGELCAILSASIRTARRNQRMRSQEGADEGSG